jgi:hypothetical protein
MVPEREIPGNYAAKADWGRSSLLVKGDGTFEQTLTTNIGYTRRIRGEWKFENGFILLKPCLQITYDGEGIDADVCAHAVEAVGLGRTEISLDPDKGFAYSKQ